VARQKAKDSPWTYGGLGLSPEEEKHLQKYLKRKEWSLAKFKRMLIRSWMKTQTIGVIE
jgi:hypothetical protein